LPSELLSGMLQGPVLGLLLFYVFINGQCNVIEFSNYPLSADDIQIFKAIKSPYGCSLLQMDIDIIHGRWIVNLMMLNVSKTRVISFTRGEKKIASKEKHCRSHINHADTIKDLGVFLHSTVYFHHHMDYIHSQALKLLYLIRTTNISFSSFGSLLIFYFNLVSSILNIPLLHGIL
jgi:hypothetical protein